MNNTRKFIILKFKNLDIPVQPTTTNGSKDTIDLDSILSMINSEISTFPVENPIQIIPSPSSSPKIENIPIIPRQHSLYPIDFLHSPNSIIDSISSENYDSDQTSFLYSDSEGNDHSN